LVNIKALIYIFALSSQPACSSPAHADIRLHRRSQR